MIRVRAVLPALLCLALGFVPIAGVAAEPQAEAPVEGRDYVVVEGVQPWGAADGRIEVLEVFAYTCGHCEEFQPVLSAWARKLPDDVRFEYLPAAYDLGNAFARGFFAARAENAVERVHAPLYRAVHHDGLLANNATIDEVAWFLGEHGLDKAAAKATMASPAVDALMQRARDFQLGIRLRGTPTLVVDGRYVVTPRTHQDALRITGQLVDRLRSGALPRATRTPME
ncbi:MAG: thiol:disulfide interchange protein DsbA/DsbL [Pseudomonadota bacterium]|nr:thiol:disulfide interchange protein DsbA/DsbL [Pseudomonadota bacterium]